MNEIKYTGEHLWVGQIGHILLIMSFVAALFSAFSYFLSVKNKNTTTSAGWNTIGRSSYYVHGVVLISFMILLFYAMYNHMYEYSYVFDHVSEELPLKYILSAFWEGQEGSFMLWMFWHVILGIILSKTTGKLEAPVMVSIALAEAILMSMLLGIHIPWDGGTIKIGSNPTTLLRSINDAPIFANADYLSLIKGRGMNPLLQNYWMTIHPPTLFLGFASTIVPFAFAFAGLMIKDHKEWIKQSLNWSLFSAGILGTGLVMGSLWAYVALSFGGYWAWDPVENASLVPWLTLIAGIHVHLISKNTGYATRALYFFYLISFVLILYSTFLTRSGVLGDTSAHAFTEMGLEWQLIFIMAVFTIPGFFLLLKNYKNIKNPEKEEELSSREFWMFIGALILLFSAILISTSTSLPVYNKIMTYFNPAFEGRVVKDAIEHYNKYQLWIAVFVATLSSFSLYLRYQGVNWNLLKKKFFIHLIIHIFASLILTWLFSLWLKLYSWQYIVLCLAGFFSIISNLDYIVNTVKGNIKLAWSAISHFGFGMMIIGILGSGLNQKNISSNPFVFQGMFTNEDIQKYVQLIKGKPLYSQGYFITYQSDTLIGRERKYEINFKQLNDSLEVIDEMNLFPNAVYSNDFTKVAAFNPDTKHYIHKDIFSCIVGLPPALQSAEEARKIEDSLKFVNYTVAINDTIHINEYILQPEAITFKPLNEEYNKHTHDAGIGVRFVIRNSQNDSLYRSEAALGMEGALMYHYPAVINEAGIRIKLDEAMFDSFITADDALDYKEYTIKNNGIININDIVISLEGFNKDPEHPGYIKEPKDIAVAAKLKITSNNSTSEARPIYVIRDNVPMSIKHYDVETGLHIRFSNINPATEEFSFKIAKEKRHIGDIKLKVASDVPRNDYLILQATIFPGINLFWTGCILMMLGLFMAAWFRYRQRMINGI
ncbi:MAG: cytochrome c biogenesis protein CcsA [Saprospiraceae bacterium]